MKNEHRTVRSTIILGGLGALAWFLAGSAFAWHRYWPWAAFGILWLMTAVYAFMLVQWSGRRPVAVFFPLLALAVIGACLPGSAMAFGLVLAVLSWVRSGICFPRTVCQSVWRELVLCAGGGVTILLWAPSTPLAGALGLWLFSLVQALFFIIFEPGSPSLPAGPCADPFDQAVRRIEDLLEGL